MIYSVTGHRPPKIGGYSEEAFNHLVRIFKWAVGNIIDRPDKVITGMALGWDTAVAQACVDMQIPFVAAVPFTGQESRWFQSSKTTYSRLLSEASEVVVVCSGGYAAWKMQIRNQWMVNHADRVIAMWDGSSGGTSNCLDYAVLQNKLVVNLFKFISFLPGE